MAICPFAQWHGPVPNKGGKMGPIKLGVVHIMQGSLSGSDGWFHNPSAQVSAHFGIGKDGTIYQWVDTNDIAWAEANFNGKAISVEHEGYAGERLTDKQAWSLACLMKWARLTHGLPIRRTFDPNGTGWLGHGELGNAGGGHQGCPGQPILDQLPGIISFLHHGKVPAGPAAPATLPALSQGATGMAVIKLQQHLGVTADGVFGPATTASVKLFQQTHHLLVDGVVGAATWSALGV